MREIIIKSMEEECGVDLYKLFIPSHINSEDLSKILDMASNYASASADIYDEDDAKDYGLDEHWEEVYQAWGNCNGIDRFFGYLNVVYGWEYKDITYDYEFEW